MKNTVYVLEVETHGVYGYAGIYSTNEKCIEAETEYRKHFELGDDGVNTAIRPVELDEFSEVGKYMAAKYGTYGIE